MAPVEGDKAAPVRGVDSLDVACWCGRRVELHHGADVRAGTCGFSCGREGCEP